MYVPRTRVENSALVGHLEWGRCPWPKYMKCMPSYGVIIFQEISIEYLLCASEQSLKKNRSDLHLSSQSLHSSVCDVWVHA